MQSLVVGFYILKTMISKVKWANLVIIQSKPWLCLTDCRLRCGVGLTQYLGNLELLPLIYLHLNLEYCQELHSPSKNVQDMHDVYITMISPSYSNLSVNYDIASMDPIHNTINNVNLEVNTKQDSVWMFSVSKVTLESQISIRLF